jgi:8-oxo-dGTP pyrophosphatase MutT (NUDIX family)
VIDWSFNGALRRRISANLTAFKRQPARADGLKRAAIAITIVARDDGAAAFVLTRRASGMRNHAGQMALPGGRLDPGETPVVAALRELQEEVNAVVGPEGVLGLLDDYPTRSGYLITPVVVWADREVELVPNPDEVASIQRVPLSELERPDSPKFRAIPESDRPMIQLPIFDDHLHAPSAAMVYQFREAGMHGRDTRVDHLEQPVWAWR